jgi:DNA repair protein RecO (recombination protein O)
VAFSGSSGGVVCSSCEGGGFPLSRDAHEFMVAALGKPIAELPAASEGSLRQVERAIGDTLSHHAHVNLRSVA